MIDAVDRNAESIDDMTAPDIAATKKNKHQLGTRCWITLIKIISFFCDNVVLVEIFNDDQSKIRWRILLDVMQWNESWMKYISIIKILWEDANKSISNYA